MRKVLVGSLLFSAVFGLGYVTRIVQEREESEPLQPIGRIRPNSAPSPPSQKLNAPLIECPGDLLLGDLQFRLIPEGTCIIGSPPDEPQRDPSEQQQLVLIADPFYLLATEVTCDQYAQRMGVTTSRAISPDQPVTDVNCDQVASFCQSLESEFPDYHFRLPSEQEWEYACRAGQDSMFPVPVELEDELRVALDKSEQGDADYLERFVRQIACCGESGPHPVAEAMPNEWGLYDMAGNVWEWCADDELSDRDLRPIRGGAWSSTTLWGCRAAARGEEYRDVQKPSIGFRILAQPY